MIKALTSALLLLITANVYSNSSDTIDLGQVTRLLNQQSSKPAFNNQTNRLEEQQTNTQCILTGKVIRVVDGDTVYVLDEKKKQHNIRLAGIDAPERGQPYGKAATKYLKELITGKNVCVDWYKKDRYKRLVGVIHYKNQDINYQMVQKGYA